MKNILLIGLLSFMLSGCFFQEKFCDCFTDCQDAVSFSFDTDSAKTGFRFSEVDTVLVYQLAKGQSNILDSALFIRKSNNSGYFLENNQNDNCNYSLSSFTLIHGFPFSRGLLQDFDYQIVVPQLKVFTITNIEIEGHDPKDDCICYDNTKKWLLVNGVHYDQTDKPLSENAIVLTK